MSFLGELVGSIGGEKPPAPPPQIVRPPSRPASTNATPQSSASKSAPSAPSTSRPVYKGTAGLGAPQQTTSLKRKAEEISSERPVKLPRTSLQSNSDHDGQKPSKLNSTEPQPTAAAKPSNGSISQPSQNASKPPTKPPAKGSYAALMARAKDAQSSKTPSSIGMIKHQATEKVKTSKLAERKRMDQDKDKSRVPGANSVPKAGANAKLDLRRRSSSPVKKGEAPKIVKAPQPPLHGPRRESAPTYKGTMGQAPKKSRDDTRQRYRNRSDQYLGTDEEDDEDGYGYDDDGDEYYSDESSDMEGGFDDLEMEERVALKAAKDDDARELALENKLKREKEERKRKLAAMAKKHGK